MAGLGPHTVPDCSGPHARAADTLPTYPSPQPDIYDTFRQNYRDRNQVNGYQAGLGKIKLKKKKYLHWRFFRTMWTSSAMTGLHRVAQLLEHNTDDHEGSSLYRACLESTEPWVRSQCTCLYSPITSVGRKESEIQNHYQLHSAFKASLVYPNPPPRPNVPIC